MGSTGLLWCCWWAEYDCPYRDMAPSESGNVKPGCKPPAATAATAAVLASAAILSFSSSASCSLLALARRFWNQIFTWVSVRVRDEENSARSAIDRYCFCLNFLSRARSWDVVKGVRGFLLVLCFLNWHEELMWPRRGKRESEWWFNRGMCTRLSVLVCCRFYCVLHISKCSKLFYNSSKTNRAAGPQLSP